MPRLVLQSRAPSRDERGCPCCHKRHAEHLPHIGSVSDWNADECARLPYREWPQPLEALAWNLERGNCTNWQQRVARALDGIIDSDVARQWVAPGGYDIPADHVVYIVPAYVGIQLACGVVERFGAGITHGCSRTKVAGPASFRPNAWPSIWISHTGLLLVASATGRGVDDRLSVDEADKQLVQETST